MKKVLSVVSFLITFVVVFFWAIAMFDEDQEDTQPWEI